MIQAIEYTPTDDLLYLRADKHVAERPAWHLRTIDGNGMAPTSMEGTKTYGLPGTSYDGMQTDSREIGVKLYADAYSHGGLQEMLDEAARLMSPWYSGKLGYLKLENAAGKAFRIACKPTSFDVTRFHRRTAEVEATFGCPHAFFEDADEHRAQLFAADGSSTIVCTNDGDYPAPVIIEVHGAGVTKVQVDNLTTGQSITTESLDSVGGLSVSTDPFDAWARFEDGTDATRYVSLFSAVSDFHLAPGENNIKVTATATSITTESTYMSWRGRYTTCL